MSSLTGMNHLLGDSSNKVDWIVNHVLYMVATGKWPPGSRLPSIREAEERWMVNRATIQKAYRRIEARGIIIARSQSGFYVNRQDMIERVSRHRHELQCLYRFVAKKILKETGLFPAAAFRYLARLAEIEEQEHPTCAFVECTRPQAQSLATEISGRLGVPVIPLTIDEIGGKRTRIPEHVRFLLTTHFHLGELAPLASSSRLSVSPVTIELEPDLAAQFGSTDRRAVLFESEEGMAQSIASDLGSLSGRRPIEVRIINDVESALSEELLKADKPPLLLLSPRIWGAVGRDWHDHPSVFQVKYRIESHSWRLIADALGLPLGEANAV